MGVFEDVLKDDAAFGFCQTEGFGAEAVSFTPAGGSARTIYGPIERDPAEPDENGVLRPVYSMFFQNHATDGISSSATDTIGGTVTFARSPGGANLTLTIAQHNLRIDAGGVTLRWPRA